MSDFEDKHLDFVLKHYQEGRFDTQKAIKSFNEANGIVLNLAEECCRGYRASLQLSRSFVYSFSVTMSGRYSLWLILKYRNLFCLMVLKSPSPQARSSRTARSLLE